MSPSSRNGCQRCRVWPCAVSRALERRLRVFESVGPGPPPRPHFQQTARLSAIAPAKFEIGPPLILFCCLVLKLPFSVGLHFPAFPLNSPPPSQFLRLPLNFSALRQHNIPNPALKTKLTYTPLKTKSPTACRPDHTPTTAVPPLLTEPCRRPPLGRSHTVSGRTALR